MPGGDNTRVPTVSHAQDARATFKVPHSRLALHGFSLALMLSIFQAPASFRNPAFKVLLPNASPPFKVTLTIARSP